MTTQKRGSKKVATPPATTATPKVSLVEEAIELQIGIRELRQDASRVIALVESGAIITITKHGKPVATINPAKKSKLDILIDKGVISPAKKDFDFRTWKPKVGPAPQEILKAIRRDREEERY